MINIWQDLFCIVTLDGRFQKVSKAWESILGYKEEEVEGKNFREIIHPEDLDSAMKHMTDMAQGGKTSNAIIRFRNRNGSYHWLEWRAAPGEDKNLIFAVAREISQYKVIEEEIRLKTWTLNERLKEMNCLYTVTNCLQDVTSLIENTIPKLLSPIINAYQHPEITAVKISIEGRDFTSDNFTESEWKQSAVIYISEQAGGKIEVCYLKEMPMFSEGPFLKEERTLIDSLANLIGQYINRSTSYRQTSLLASVMDASIDAIGTFKFDGTILSWSKGAERLYGLTAKEMIGKNIVSIYAETRKKDLEYFVSQLRQGKSIDGFETQRVKRDGTILDVFVVMTPLKNAAGEYDSYVTVLRDITEQKRKERILKESEAGLKAAQKLAKIGSWKIDFTSGKHVWSDELYAILEMDKVTVVPSFERYLERVHPNDRKMIVEDHESTASDAISHDRVHRLLMPDGRIKMVNNRTSTTFNVDKQPIETYGSVQDITQLHESQVRQAQLEERFREVAQDAGEWIWEMDQTGLYTYASPASIEIFGLNPEEIVGKKYFYDFFVPELKEMYTKMSFLARDEKRRIKKFVNQVVHKEGHVVFLETTGSPMFDSGKNVVGYRGASMNVSDQIKAQESLKKSEEQFRLLAENVTDVIWTLDINGKFLYVSPSVEKMRGFTPQEVMQQTMAETLSPASAELAFKSLEESIPQIMAGEQPPPTTILLEQPCKDGGTVWTEATISTIFDDQGKFLFFLGVTRDITDRKAIEDAMKKSEEQFRLLAENVNDVIWTLDINGRFLYLSPSLERVRGYKPEEVINQTLDEALTPASARSAKLLLHDLKKRIEAGERIPIQTLNLEQPCKDGSTIWTEATVNATFDEQGKFLFFLGVTRDITARRNVEKLREQERMLLKTLIDNFPSSIWFVDKDFRKTVVNNLHLKRIAKALGRDAITEEEIIGKTNFEVYPAEIANEYFNQDKSVIQDGIALLNIEVCTKGEKGEPLWESISKLPVHNKDGEILGMLGIAHDITERKHAEHLNKLNSDRIAAQYRISFLEDKSEEEIIALALEEAVKLTQSESGFFHFLDEAQQNLDMTGWSSSVTKNCNRPESTHYPVTEAGIWAQCIQSHKPFLCNDYEGHPGKKGLPDGHFQLIRFITCPVIDNEKVALVIGVGNKNLPYEENEASQLSTFMEEVWKVIKKSRLNEQLKVARFKAEESNKLKTSLMLNMSHEFRTPLNGILGFAGLLKEMVRDDEARNMAEYINMSGKRLMVTLTSILELSQLESDKKIINLEEINLSDLSHKVISKFSDLLDFKKLHLSKIIEENLVLKTDKGMVSNIFYYIIDNAIKFTDTGQVWVSLQRTQIKGTEYLVFKVRDTGIGISDEQLRYIFEPFRQGSEGIGRSHEGNGLGLTLCKKFLDLLGARLEIESRLDLGSTFSVFFSLAQPGEEAEIVAPLLADSGASISSSKREPGVKPRILVVEDNEINVELIMMYLEDRFIVEKALNGKMALKLASINDYDLILMDINLGSDMDGIEVTREIRKMKKYEKLPIIAVTGYATDREKQAILSHGLNDYISKPFTKAELDSVIQRVIV
jgi:PAS domain S-box-containing protein